MKTHELTDREPNPAKKDRTGLWIRARLARKRIVLEAKPHHLAFKEFAFENKGQVREFIDWLESAAGKTYDRPKTPPFLRRRMRIEGRRDGLFMRWDHHPRIKDRGYTLYATTEDVHRFIFELMRLFIWQ